MLPKTKAADFKDSKSSVRNIVDGFTIDDYEGRSHWNV